MNKAPLYGFKIGDSVKVIFKIPKGAKTKPTPFEGTVLSIRGDSESKTFTVRKMSYAKVAVEKIFPLTLPAIENVQVIKSGTAKRAKLYHLRK